MPANLLKECIQYLEKWLPSIIPIEVKAGKKENFRSKAGSRSKIRKKKILIFILRVLPSICLLGFATSLFYDFSGSFHLPWRDIPISLDGLGRKLSVTGLVGFATNWLAVKMLFYPRKKRPLFGQGVIASRKEDIVMRLGEQIGSEIINSQLITDKISKSNILRHHWQKAQERLRKLLSSSNSFHQDTAQLLQQAIRNLLLSQQFRKLFLDFIHNVDTKSMRFLEANIFKFYCLFINEESLSRYFERLADNLNVIFQKDSNNLYDHFQILSQKFPDNANGEELEKSLLKLIIIFIEKLNVQDIITQNLKNFDELRLEKLLWRTTSHELLYIQYIGCFLGILGGFFVWLPYEASIGFSFLFLSAWSLDSLLYARTKNRKNNIKAFRTQ